MPERTPRTKKEKQNAVHTVMHEFKHGELHSGSKHGPKVKGRKQAVAIALSEAGMSNKSAKQPHPKTNPGAYDSSPHSGADRAKPAEKLRGPQPHAFDAVAESMSERDRGVGNQPTVPMRHSPPLNAHGYGHSGAQRSGVLRLSGVKGAHRIGAK